MLGEDLLAPVGEVADGLVRARGELIELVGEHPPERVGHRWGEGDALVVVGDELLDPVHGCVGHVTGGALVVAAQADEVRVYVPVPVLRVDDRGVLWRFRTVSPVAFRGNTEMRNPQNVCNTTTIQSGIQGRVMP
ncbi:hypothetical protein, partial [Gulosibacter molinativorax]|uniref:hypothetical protein n=1 Tax=Gulosibacter molinativorax TaxID=256821 RepID=UPI0024BF02DB